ncbi:uncharacterized protein [Diadema antillarum]|uniref:uncharacterized protein n=1 Tax=Diadema antillarum TaxID=105358 RepID=UPI003A8AA3CF
MPGPIVFISILVCLSQHTRPIGALPRPSALNFIGVGYNILDGNPEGAELSSGGVDPGINIGRRVLGLTWDDDLTSTDGEYSVPDQCVFVPRSSAFTTSTRSTFYGTASYASKLSAQVDVSGSYSSLFSSVEFSASSRYQEISSRVSSLGTVYFSTETVQNLGHARYMTSLASSGLYPLGDDFVASACQLPSSYNEYSYMTFLSTWGTHVVTEVDVGVRSGVNYESETSSFVEYAATETSNSLSAGGSYGGFSASLSVNMDTFNSQMNSGTSFGSEYSSYTVGSTSLNEPISLTMMTMNEAFDDAFWLNRDYSQYCASNWDRASVKGHVLTALTNYATYRSLAATPDPGVTIPITWPVGTYGLQKPTTGCPSDWDDGYRYHDTEDDNSNNYWSNPFTMSGYKGSNNRRDEFCIKTVSNMYDYQWIWQPGSYCIYKRGDCPENFDEGSIYWDDEDDNNRNSHGGQVPDGSFGGNTRLYFCCRNDGATNNEIYLPTDQSFVLLSRYGTCQQVYGMSVREEYFRYDNEDDNNRDSQTAVHPYQGLQSSGHNVVLEFCFYQRD